MFVICCSCQSVSYNFLWPISRAANLSGLLYQRPENSHTHSHKNCLSKTHFCFQTISALLTALEKCSNRISYRTTTTTKTTRAERNAIKSRVPAALELMIYTHFRGIIRHMLRTLKRVSYIRNNKAALPPTTAARSRQHCVELAAL